MKGKSTVIGSAWEEGRTSEFGLENTPVTKGNLLELIFASIWPEEHLLKACASRQEKPALCHKNGASAHSDFANRRRCGRGGKLQVAGPADFHALAQVHLLAGSHDPAINQVADCASRRRTGGRVFA